jgi:hypothetical protein
LNTSSRSFVLSAIVLFSLSGPALSAAPAPLALHPENPHYFLFRGKPAVLITSGEHYGAVLNLDFDFARYLKALEADGMNLTRTFSGAYVEPAGAFGIARNTLAPVRDRFICPWARSATPGYPNGGNKFDLNRWDEGYFKRLREFVAEAGRRGVVVEINLFCPFYEEDQWALSPQNAANNVNGVGKVGRNDVYTLDKSGGLLAVHEAMVRKFVAELAEFDNLYYEICNEPYFGGVTLAWQHRIADIIVDAEKSLPGKHLISRNVANGGEKVEKPHPAISIFNFHYATPPDTVAQNYGLGKAIGDNETGFKGVADRHYRMEGWEFILAGGGLYNNLDYSFVAGHEDGTFKYPDKQPGGGTPALRRQLRNLQEFMCSLPFLRMRPAPEALKGGVDGKNVRARVLAEPGKAYGIYITGKAEKLELDLPAGKYRVEWVSPVSGKVEKSETLDPPGGIARLAAPSYPEDMALRILRD